MPYGYEPGVQSLKILVTGGAGFIGSHTCKALAAKGFEPVAYDNLSRGNRWAVKWGPLEEGDIADAGRVRAVLEQHRPAAVMHFAAFAYVGESVREPLLYYRNNIGGTTALLQALIDYGPLPFVFSSTCSTYGIPRTVPIPEDHPQNPINSYGFSKMVVERMLGDLELAHGLRSISLRYFNAAGADPEGEIGEAHDPETHLVPLVLAAARDGTSVRVFGTDYETPDGTCIRDYIHIKDLAQAHILGLQPGKSGFFNLGNGDGYSVKQVIEMCEKITGKKIPAIEKPRRAGDPPKLVAAANKAFNELGWKPQYPKLEDIVATAWAWHKKHPTGYPD